jgi:hypothetical protein
MRKAFLILMTMVAAASTASAPIAAQVRTIDPNEAVDNDLHNPQAQTPAPDNNRMPDEPVSAEPPPPPQDPRSGQPSPTAEAQLRSSDAPPASSLADANAASGRDETFKDAELLGAAEKTFGKGAAGLAGILRRTLKEQGEPNAYIAGREAGGAVVVGLRYGKGTMFHKVEGQQPVYWTGPSVGFDLGGDGSKVFVLVYNLYDSEDLFSRFPAAEGRLYFVGGFAATYLRRGNIVLIPIRLGVGWRQGVNLGYMKFSHKSRWFPF